jgi:glycosyltransferase involved in cell wall biosynthesis
MKIVILVRILWTAGAPKVAIDEYKVLERLGHDVHLIFLRKTPSGDLFLPLLGSMHWNIMSSGSPSRFTSIYDLITGIFMPDRKGDGRLDYDLIREFPSYIKDSKPDLVICHDQWAGLAGYYAFKKYGVKYVTILHESLGEYRVPFLGKMANHYEKRTLKNSHRIFAINETIANSVKRLYHFTAIVNYHGMDSISTVNYDNKKNLIVASSTWDKNRARDVYLKATIALPDYKLFIAGRWRDASLKESYVKLINQYNLSKRVELIDSIDETELKRLYACSKFVMRFGYKESGNPHAIIDALSNGTLPILNSELGIAKLIKDFDAGLIVDPTHEDQIVQSIKRADNAKEYSKFQDNISKLCSIYTWEKHCKLILDSL